MENILATIALALGASFCAGINLYATIFVLGAMSRYTSFDLPVEMIALESHWVIWPALAMYVVEFFADKIPAVDTAWDSIHTFLRIPAGVAIAATALGDVPMELQVVAGMVGGTLASVSHTTKATTRLAAHATGTSPVVSPVVSVVEDVLVVGTLGFIATNPVLSILILIVMLIAAFFILKTFWKLAQKVFQGIAALFRRTTPPIEGAAA